MHDLFLALPSAELKQLKGYRAKQYRLDSTSLSFHLHCPSGGCSSATNSKERKLTAIARFTGSAATFTLPQGIFLIT